MSDRKDCSAQATQDVDLAETQLVSQAGLAGHGHEAKMRIERQIADDRAARAAGYGSPGSFADSHVLHGLSGTMKPSLVLSAVRSI